MIQALLAYQAVDEKLKAIEMQLSANEDRKKAAAAKKFLESVNETADRLEAKAGELAQGYKLLAEKQKELIDNIGEYDNVDGFGEDEVEYVKKKAKELDEKIVSLDQELKRLEKAVKDTVDEYSALRQKTVKAQEQYRESAAKYNEARAAVQSERDEITAELEKLKKDVDPELMEIYLAKRRDKMPLPIVYACKGELCPACGMGFSLQEMNELKIKKTGECEHCRRMIFIS